MIVRNKDEWISRLGFSLLFGAGAVIASTLFFVAVAAKSNSKLIELVSYIFVVPLLPGWGFIAMFFNAWQAVHQGQIALVPFISLPVDSAVIFVVWHYIMRRKERQATSSSDKYVTLHLS
jgi:uncharacterized membrane protein